MNSLPVDADQICSNLGIRVRYVDTHVSGVLEKNTITVSTRLSAHDRRRMIVHLTAHFLSGHDQVREQRPCDDRQIIATAARLAMPDDAFLALEKRFVPDFFMAEFFGVDLSDVFVRRTSIPSQTTA
ncbi:ImmA/IrrE family metallo-endopeptidase [Actinomyces vulturis]|uniref:ImmA/IrrE family metallo-endopeptidase n=1 Tax=Actinomyces vulturis TaxID=1857645 RepID=UPI0009F71CD6